MLPVLAGAAEGQGEVALAARNAIAGIETSLAVWNMGQNIWFGISLGSVLLLAAVGLAITFGVMGVINMAHGEMVMLGAYSTFVVQEVIRNHAPGLFDCFAASSRCPSPFWWRPSSVSSSSAW